MNKQEWIKLFEDIHGRKPSPIELKQGQDCGEINEGLKEIEISSDLVAGVNDGNNVNLEGAHIKGQYFSNRKILITTSLVVIVAIIGTLFLTTIGGMFTQLPIGSWNLDKKESVRYDDTSTYHASSEGKTLRQEKNVLNITKDGNVTFYMTYKDSDYIEKNKLPAIKNLDEDEEVLEWMERIGEFYDRSTDTVTRKYFEGKIENGKIKVNKINDGEVSQIFNYKVKNGQLSIELTDDIGPFYSTIVFTKE